MDANNLLEYKAIESMSEEKGGYHGGLMTAVWVVAAVIIIALVVYVWNKGCNEKTQIAVGMAKLDGRVDAIEPALTAQGNNLYKLNGVVSATVQGVGDLKECTNEKLACLENQVLFQRRNGGCGCGGNREFRQTSTYNLASTNVTVDETCRN